MTKYNVLGVANLAILCISLGYLLWVVTPHSSSLQLRVRWYPGVGGGGVYQAEIRKSKPGIYLTLRQACLTCPLNPSTYGSQRFIDYNPLKNFKAVVNKEKVGAESCEYVLDFHTSKVSKELKVVLLHLWRVTVKTTRGFINFPFENFHIDKTSPLIYYELHNKCRKAATEQYNLRLLLCSCCYGDKTLSICDAGYHHPRLAWCYVHQGLRPQVRYHSFFIYPPFLPLEVKISRHCPFRS